MPLSRYMLWTAFVLFTACATTAERRPAQSVGPPASPGGADGAAGRSAIAYSARPVHIGDSLRVTMEVSPLGENGGIVVLRLRLENEGRVDYKTQIPGAAAACHFSIMGDIVHRADSAGEHIELAVSRLLTIQPGEAFECAATRRIELGQAYAALRIRGTLRTQPRHNVDITVFFAPTTVLD